MPSHQQFAGFGLAAMAGVPVLTRRDDRCKTFRVTMLWQRPRGAGQAARALLPLLLQHGTATRDRPALARARELLWGAGGGFGIGRHAETSVLTMTADAVAGRFLPGEPDQFEPVLALAREQLLAPRFREDGADELFVRERAQALAAARAVFDDKTAYARLRAVTTACAGEPYGVPENGGEDAIAAVRRDEPAAMLDDFLARGRGAVFLSGVLPAATEPAIAALLAALPERRPEPLLPPVQPDRRPVGRTVEHAPMQQAKLVLVLRMARPTAPRELAALQLALSLWGGGTHSRLFQEVREKRSLCYYAGAGGDADKGICLMQSGCAAASCDAVVAEAIVQLEALAAGAFTPAELATAVAACQAPYRSIDDSPASRLAFTADQWLRGFDQEPAGRIADLAAVGADEVAAAAASLWLDHDYRLVPGESM